MKPALYILSFILFFSFELMTGQNISLSASNKKAAKNYKLAEDYYRKRDYNPTLEYLKIAVKKDNNFIEAWLLMGDVYTDLDRNKLAIDAFQNAIRIDSNFFPRAFYFIGNLAFKEGDYPMSAGYIKRYLCFKGEEEITRFIAKQRLLRAQFADSLITHPVAQKPENLGSTVNTVSDEYVNFVDEVLSKLILTRKSIVDTGSQGSKFYEESFYETDAANGRWGTPELIKLKWQEGRNLGGMRKCISQVATGPKVLEVAICIILLKKEITGRRLQTWVLQLIRNGGTLSLLSQLMESVFISVRKGSMDEGVPISG